MVISFTAASFFSILVARLIVVCYVQINFDSDGGLVQDYNVKKIHLYVNFLSLYAKKINKIKLNLGQFTLHPLSLTPPPLFPMPSMARNKKNKM